MPAAAARQTSSWYVRKEGKPKEVERSVARSVGRGVRGGSGGAGAAWKPKSPTPCVVPSAPPRRSSPSPTRRRRALRRRSLPSPPSRVYGMGEIEIREGRLDEARKLLTASVEREKAGSVLLSLARLDWHDGLPAAIHHFRFRAETPLNGLRAAGNAVEWVTRSATSGSSRSSHASLMPAIGVRGVSRSVSRARQRVSASAKTRSSWARSPDAIE